MTRYIGAILAGLLVLSTAAQAQSSNSSSGRMWGSNAGSSGAPIDSSNMHVLDGNSAGQVNAAKQGFLFGGGSTLTITAIGSQSIVSTTVIGNNNATNVAATQTTSNTGTVSNNGTITRNNTP